MKKMKFIVNLGLIALLSFSVFSCGNKKEAVKVEENAAKDVRVMTTRKATVPQQLEFMGTVQPFNENNIVPVSPGRIDRIFVEVGSRVGKGQLLVQMDESQLIQSKAQLENLQLEYRRMDTLLKAGSISQQKYDQMKLQLDVAKTAFKTLSDNTKLLSPLTGIVTAKNYENGDMYSGTPSANGKAAIVTVMQIVPVKMLINITEEFYPKVKVGMPVSVKLDVYGDKEFTGKVHLIYPTIDPLTRTFTVEISIPNNKQEIRPGMFGRVSINFGDMPRILVPDIAVQKQSGTNDRFVFTVSGDNVAHRKVVNIGRKIGNDTEIISGLEENETVIVAGAARLNDKSKIKIIK